MLKDEKKSKSWVWTVLAVINVVGIAFPLSYYLQTDGGTQIFAAVVLVCAGFFLLILDGITAFLANFNVNEL
jgi:prepilin signal peptidase PulO-like enzyme (type II secretory pathway)